LHAAALPQWELIARLLLAAGLGSVIGIERERSVRSAGLRTHMLVSVGSCLIIIVSAYGFDSVLGDHVVLDPSRVAAQVVSGIGFLGAGSIILRNEAIKGLTTAASIWAVAAIGLAAGAGLYTAAIASTLIILAILAGLKPLEARYTARRTSLDLQLTARTGETSLAALERALGGHGTRVRQLVVQHDDGGGHDDVTLILDRVSSRDAAEIMLGLERLPFVLSVSEKGPDRAPET
jgi:putative Mg2+ transporter-C (MgtC) family protein